jgi:hypothetical protein
VVVRSPGGVTQHLTKTTLFRSATPGSWTVTAIRVVKPKGRTLKKVHLVSRLTIYHSDATVTPIAAVAVEWRDAGFTAEEAKRWIDAGFDITDAKASTTLP